MKERPIIFSGEMVRAILDERKSQTRRVVKPQPIETNNSDGWTWGERCYGRHRGDMLWDMVKSCKHGTVGDQLWVRETWKPTGLSSLWPIKHTKGWARFAYRADPNQLKRDEFIKWRPSIHMPRWASRILLESTNIRVERVQDISESDSICEGSPSVLISLDWFRDLWNSINAKWKRVYNRELKHYEFWQYPWCEEDAAAVPKTTKHPERYHVCANPWVWVIDFKRVLAKVRE